MKWTWTGKPATLKQIKEQVGEGWGDIIERLVTDLQKFDWDGQVTQVKEKFGGLRFYIEDGSTEIFNRIHEAENESYKICESCGKPGKLDQREYWVRTLCPDCMVLRDKLQAEAHVKALRLEELRKKNEPVLNSFRGQYSNHPNYDGLACLGGEEMNIIDAYTKTPEKFPSPFEGLKVNSIYIKPRVKK